MLLKDKNYPSVKLLEEIPENLRVISNLSDNRRGLYKELRADFELDRLYRGE